MLPRVAFFVLVVLCLVQEESCFSCPKDENLSDELKELLTLTDELEKAVTDMLNEPKDRKKLKEFTEYMQSHVCTEALNSTTVSSIKIIYEDLVDGIKEGYTTEDDIVELLQMNPSELLESYADGDDVDSNTEDDYNDENTEKEE
ncbi:hypothetical protein XELAEV_18036821mg [Xenopus laevis]|uniref:Uncharacterized protein n=1 Tax=Xenopus laevis TaxID=8355 RepID=A0A974CBE6_XENLA|nr:hypothetical protein XELAEV_18036821mg [Xenopus laevis]